MSFDMFSNGNVISSPEDIIGGMDSSQWSGSFTFSNGTFTLTKGTANLNRKTQIKLRPDDIYCIEFDLRCISYSTKSGIYIGAQNANWTSGNVVCKQANYDFTNGKWGSWYNSNNPYYINNYISTSWGHVKSYVCGCNVDVNSIPAPDRSGGASSYSIACNKACDSSSSTYVYPNSMLFWRTGYNALDTETQFEFKCIRAYRLGNNCKESSFSVDKNGFNSNDVWEI